MPYEQHWTSTQVDSIGEHCYEACETCWHASLCPVALCGLQNIRQQCVLVARQLFKLYQLHSQLVALYCRKQVEEQQRQELLQRSHGAVDYMSKRDADSQSMSYLDNSRRVVEEAFQTGTAVLQNMSGQRERLKVCSFVFTLLYSPLEQ